jgi:hypothetical protein
MVFAFEPSIFIIHRAITHINQCLNTIHPQPFTARSKIALRKALVHGDITLFQF